MLRELENYEWKTHPNDSLFIFFYFTSFDFTKEKKINDAILSIPYLNTDKRQDFFFLHNNNNSISVTLPVFKKLYKYTN